MRVLVVDDEPGIRLSLARLLSADGFDVVAADSVGGARTRLDDDKPMLVVTDLRLGDGTGLDVQQAAHAIDPDLPVIFLSGSEDQHAAITALENGAVRFLTKPARAEEILEAVRSALHLRDMARRGASGTWRQLRAADYDRGRLDRALDAIYMVFQPVVSWSRGRVIAYEALLRSTEPSLARPDRLLAAAERAGRIVELGRRIRAAVAARIPSLPEAADVYINLHADELTDPSLCAEDSPLRAYASRVVFEITERAALSDHDDANAHLSQLRALGYRVAVDDLGAGYASLAMLAELRPDVVKIDMSLVRGVRQDPTRQVLLRALIQLGTQLGIATVAEGIEDIDDLAAVIDCGGDLFQGYLFARPATTPPPIELGGLHAQLTSELRRLSTGPITPQRAPSRADVKAPLIALAALAHSLQGGASVDDQHRIADEILRLVAQLDAMVAALGSA
ncbi:MAG TPA: EAL domain-containing protein [Kofleriaceae bacterium]|nr:EAL domain-containing protein [Kofleriaceae bacterium]